MTDRELLELAAKAAGIDLWIDTRSGFRNGADGDTWNPLEDDGDALRLAVKLGISIHIGTYRVVCELIPQEDDGNIVVHEQYADNNPFAATRRAIVRAAAALALGEGEEKWP